jgi:hypothetical protein
MPEIRQPNPPPPVRPPVCPDCSKPMRFVLSKPDKTHCNLRHALFVCDCGRISDQLSAEAA